VAGRTGVAGPVVRDPVVPNPVVLGRQRTDAEELGMFSGLAGLANPGLRSSACGAPPYVIA
jgi:hypothetical protein